MSEEADNALNNLTPRAHQVIMLARNEAQKMGHDCVGTEHLLLGIIVLGQGVAVSSLQAMGVDLASVRAAVERLSPPQGGTHIEGELPLTPRVRKVLALSMREAKALNYHYIGTEHILLGLLKEGEGVAAQVLRALNVDVESIRREILKTLDPNFVPTEAKHDAEHKADEPAAKRDGKAQKGDGLTALRQYSRDLTEMAKEKKLDPVIGRANEIERVIQVLCRRTKNNPVLIGEAGVGKTAIVEGLAQAIVDGTVPDIIRGKMLVALDLPQMIAGTQYRGQFEERIKAVMEELRVNRNVILFIDELHTLVGAGSAEGAMDAANILKPALSRGEIQCIGATTMDEYRKHIEKDSALERRFQPIVVNQPSIEDAIQILKGIVHKYEDHHHVKYSEAALVDAVKLSDRYITGRMLPDKAIDVMDEAGSRARIAAMVRPPDMKDVEARIADLQIKKKQSIEHQKFEEAAALRDQEKNLRRELETTLEQWKADNRAKVVQIDTEQIAVTLSKLTGIPVARLEQCELEKLLTMEKELERVVVGQSDAVHSLCRALRRSRADLKDPKRPIGSFIFLGPTGVGKTHLAKNLAAFMFGDADAIVQVDMSEYGEKHNSSRLIGSPPGYVGHGEGGELTEKVRRRPYCVVLFDEIEKAHPDVMNLLLQILEEGVITDTNGVRVDFRNTIIILTSNVGASTAKGQGVLSFSSNSEDIEYELVAERMQSAARKSFKPEFLNRIDEIIVFRELSRPQLRNIVDLELAKINNRLAVRGVSLSFSDDLRDFLIEKGYRPEYGARPLRRAVERHIEDALAEDILRGRIPNGSKVEVKVDGTDPLTQKLLFFTRTPEDMKAMETEVQEQEKI